VYDITDEESFNRVRHPAARLPLAPPTAQPTATHSETCTPVCGTWHDTASSQVKHWVKELRKIVGKGIALVIAGNKCDLEKQRAVSDVAARA
jgi:hypothetical protein